MFTRETLIEKIRKRGQSDPRTIEAVENVPREKFVPSQMRALAYKDSPLPIGLGQTISQPSLVALMTSRLELTKSSKVLEVGTGCGYQTAILCELAKHVYSVEVRAELANEAEERLKTLGYRNFTLRVGDGTRGWPEHAPFDAIILTAAGVGIPPTLIEQLTVGGKMVIPYGEPEKQKLYLISKTESGTQAKELLAVRFVPIVHE